MVLSCCPRTVQLLNKLPTFPPKRGSLRLPNLDFWYDELVIGPRVLQCRGNRACNIEITRPITPWIVPPFSPIAITYQTAFCSKPVSITKYFERQTQQHSSREGAPMIFIILLVVGVFTDYLSYWHRLQLKDIFHWKNALDWRRSLLWFH